MFLAVELLVEVFEAPVGSDFCAAEAEVDVETVLDCLIDLFFDQIERRDEGLFVEVAYFGYNAFGDRVDVDGGAEDDTGSIAFVTRKIAFAYADE